jgi:hypothetical protein
MPFVDGSIGSVSFSGVKYSKKQRPLHVTDAHAETLIILSGQKMGYYHTIFRTISIVEGYPWSYKTLAVEKEWGREWGLFAKTNATCNDAKRHCTCAR